jgi:N-acetylmuramoyl-L-alanine amidase
MPVRSTGRIAACAAVLCAVLGGCTGTPTGPPPSAPPTTAPPPATPPPPSASPTAVPSGTGEPGRTPVVVLDAGHNGGNATHVAAINKPVPDGRGGTKPCNTTGTATDAGYPEHAFTFDVMARVRTRLVAAGVRVVTTRPDDAGVGPCVDERGRAGANADADAVVSIHADGAAAADRGYHVALSAPPLNPAQTGPARVLGERIRDAMRAAGFPDSDYIGRNGLSPRPDLAGLNLATRPAVLVECANMRNPTEAALVSSTAGRERYAAAISAGILAFLGR